jgi:hypothetical protein
MAFMVPGASPNRGENCMKPIFTTPPLYQIIDKPCISFS